MILKSKKPLFLILCIVFFYCCADKNPKEQEKIAVLENYPSAKTAENDSLVLALATHIEEVIAKGESIKFTQKIDLQRFVDKATFIEKQDSKISKWQREFGNGLGKGLQQLADQIVSITEMGGTYEFISYRYSEETSSYHMLFRLFSEESGINYHDFDLISFDGKFFIEDIYVYINGEMMSKTMNTFFLASLPGSLLKRILSLQNKSDMPHLVQAINQKNEGNFQVALDHVNKVRGPLTKIKLYHILKTQLAAALNDSQYQKAMLDFKATFPNDPATNMVFMDYYILNGNYEEALKSLAILQEATKDDFLHYLIGNIHFQASDYDKAISSYELIVGNYPDFDAAKFNLIASYSNENRPEKCIPLLNQLMDTELYYASDLITYFEALDDNNDNLFDTLVASKEYKNWKSENQSL
ncbi:tetratricopeptide repeat protein [Spongiimicrobium salis]|uniref:tetratricopeptide repeat protein n=1 Tax=Spongiimicrobium salis TaxID=1667022 RepID=UPI00374D40DC